MSSGDQTHVAEAPGGGDDLLDRMQAALSRLGHDAFRPGQQESIETLLNDRRLLLVAPTGGGKSLIYQLPALVLNGTTLVISPLIALMNDQVTALTERGIAATFLASTLDGDEIRQRMGSMARGEYDLVYVAPERLAAPGFRSLLADMHCPLLAIDEAHCISEWGHDFRPEYMLIGERVDQLSDSCVLACTATATPVVRDEILEKLHLPPSTPQIVRGFARPNLALRASDVRTGRERDVAIDAALAEALGKPGDRRGTAIIYSPTRRITESEADRLAGRGWVTGYYHAGLDGETRETVQKAFTDGDLDVVVATNAFGMGIDRADVRLVAHLSPPGSLEAYYQEVGRAGRDGEPATGQLLVGPSDMALRRRFIEGDAERDGNDELASHKWNQFLELMRWAEGGSCRHDAILRYFGDEAETLSGCGRCDVCLGMDSQDDPTHVSLVVRKALSGVARVHARYGLGLAAKLLHGGRDDRLERTGLANTTTFGILREHREEWIVRLIRRCVTAGWVDFVGGDRPMVVLTPEGKDVMWEKREARLALPPEHLRQAPQGGSATGSSSAGRSGRRRSAPAATDVVLDEADQILFEALRAHRLDVARTAAVPPYVVASDRTLRELAVARPMDDAGLQQIHGIGPSKSERYGQGLLDVIREMPDDRVTEEQLDAPAAEL